MTKRVFLIVLDSFGIGEMPDAAEFGDEGSNTLKACFDTGKLNVPNMRRLGLFNLDGVDYGEPYEFFGEHKTYARLSELSKGKDTTTGHWEMMGIVSEKPFPTYPDGFPPEIISEFERRTGRTVICNKPYSGTKVIADYGTEHMRSGALIVYTSADSVFQIAAHEDIVPVEELYRYCEIARGLLTGEHAVGRVIARPFTGEHPFTRTSRRHDFTLKPPRRTVLDEISEAGLTCYGVGKINDIFAGAGLNGFVRTENNADGMKKTAEFAEQDWEGLCFVNLVDFDMLYGHRNDVMGYTNALNEFDAWLGDFLDTRWRGDVVLITGDHGCDPSTPSTDHSREYVPLLKYGQQIFPQFSGTLAGFDNIGKMIKEYLIRN
ncbi:MAG: phosphopentomutase [Ruminiclostridium sp.]|nr:phosphopentomutase [Ruminiclostridium sp.]